MHCTPRRGKLSQVMYSTPGRCTESRVSMNSVILAKWHNSTKHRHRSAWESLKNTLQSKFYNYDKYWVQYAVIYAIVLRLNCWNSFTCYRASPADSYTDRRRRRRALKLSAGTRNRWRLETAQVRETDLDVLSLRDFEAKERQSEGREVVLARCSNC